MAGNIVAVLSYYKFNIKLNLCMSLNIRQVLCEAVEIHTSMCSYNILFVQRFQYFIIPFSLSFAFSMPVKSEMAQRQDSKVL